MFREFGYAGKRFADLLLTLKRKRDRHDTDRQDIHILCDLCDRCTRTRSGTAAHSCSNEQHLRAVVQRLVNTVTARFRILVCFIRISSGTESGTQLEFSRYGGFLQDLLIGIAHQECHARDALAVHVIDRIAATSANTHDLDDTVFLNLNR